MPLSKLPTVDLDNVNHRRRAREVINQVLDHTFDDSKVQTAGEIAAGINPLNRAFVPGSPYPQATARYDTNVVLRDNADLLAVFSLPRDKPGAFSFVTGTVYTCAGPGNATHDFNAENNFLATYRAQGGAGKFWVDYANGNDANDGTINTPYRTLAGCLTAASAIGTIYIKPGVITDRFDVRGSHNTISGGTAARAVLIKAWGPPGSVVFRMPGQQPGEMTWTATAAASTYDATPTGGEIALHVIYHDNGQEIQIQWYASAAAANAVQSGWYQDPATKKIYLRHANVNLSLAGVADRFEIMYTSGNEQICLGGKIYLEGITFRGGGQFTASIQTSGPNTFRPVVYARNCKWQYLAYHNFSSIGALTLLQDCVSEHSLGGDGFNYTDDAGQICEAIEVDCIGRHNGVLEYSLFDGDRNKQGSTGHVAAVILRVNGEYYGNYGQNIADTGTSSTSWMIGCQLDDPYADLSFTGIGGFNNLHTEGTAYLDCVKAGGLGSTNGLYVESGNAYLYRCEFSGSTSPIGVNTGVTHIYSPIAI